MTQSTPATIHKLLILSLFLVTSVSTFAEQKTRVPPPLLTDLESLPITGFQCDELLATGTLKKFKITSEALDWLNEMRRRMHFNLNEVASHVYDSEPDIRKYWLMRIAQQNGWLDGASGQGKTLFSTLMTDMEPQSPYLISLTPTTPAAAFRGGLDGQQYDKGIYQVEIKHSAIDGHPNITAQEGDKAVHLFSTLLDILESEKKIHIAGRPVETVNRNVVITSNAVPHEITHKIFANMGLNYKEALAVFSRILHRWHFPHSLDMTAIQRLGRSTLKENALSGFDKWLPVQESKLSKVLTLDYDGLLTMATKMFTLSDTTLASGTRIVDQVLSSARSSRKDSGRSVSAMYTNEGSHRSIKPWVNAIVISAFIDYMLLPESEKLSTAGPFVLSPLSLWRLHSILTTQIFGSETYLDFQPTSASDGDYAATLVYGRTFDNIELSKDEHYSAFLIDATNEQQLFKSSFETAITEQKKGLKKTISAIGLLKASGTNRNTDSSFDFEGRLWLLRQRSLN